MSKYIRGWKGLSEYLDDTPISTLIDLNKEGLFSKSKLGKTVIFKREEIDNAIKEVQS